MLSLLSSNNDHRVRKRSSGASYLTPLAQSADLTGDQIDLDVMHSFQKSQTSESALFAAMDTTITAGALNPYLSHMVLMQYNDSQTRISNSLTQRSALTDKITESGVANMFVSSLVPMVARKSEDQFDHVDADEVRSDSPCSSSDFSSASRRSSASSACINERRQSGLWRAVTRTRSGPISPPPASRSTHQPKRTLLHPSDCTTRKRRSGVANHGMASSESAPEYSVLTEDLKTVKMKGKLLTGDEISYSYIALNTTGTEGEETTVLYTDHPKPQFRSDLSISEKTLINSSTGLYRTLVGEVPRVLNASSPTGIPQIDDRRRDSIDSGTANDDTELEDDNSSVGKKVGVRVNSNGTRNKLPVSMVTMTSNSMKGVRYSFSPSFEDRELVEEQEEEKNTSVEEKTHHEHHREGESKPENLTRGGVSTSSNHMNNKNSIRVYQRKTSVSQVSINTTSTSPKSGSQRNPKPEFEIHIESSQESGVGIEPKSNSSRLNAKKTWASLLVRTMGRQNSNHSLRSASTDSGYKQSFSLDDNSVNAGVSPKTVRYSPQPPIDEMGVHGDDNSNVAMNETQTFYSNDKIVNKDVDEISSTLNTTVVTIENDKFRKLNSFNQTSKRGSLKRSSLKNRANNHHLDATTNNTCNTGVDHVDDGFDQNRTIEQSPLPGRKVMLPTFFDREQKQQQRRLASDSKNTRSSDSSRKIKTSESLNAQSKNGDVRQCTTSSVLEEEYDVILLDHHVNEACKTPQKVKIL